MDWENERYVRVYTRDTIDWVALGWEAQSLFLLLIRKVDRSGVLEIGKHGARGVAGLIGMPVEVVERALTVLTADGCVTICDGCLLIPNFIEAQEAKQSDKQRQKECRDRRRNGAMSHPVTEPSRIVTEGHNQSQHVTSGHTVSLQPSLPSQSNQPSESPRARSNDNANEPTVRPRDPQSLINCMKKAVERAQPLAGMWKPARWDYRDAQKFLADFDDVEAALPEIEKKIEIFAKDPDMQPWTVAKFVDKYNAIGLPKLEFGRAPKPATKPVSTPILER